MKRKRKGAFHDEATARDEPDDADHDIFQTRVGDSPAELGPGVDSFPFVDQARVVVLLPHLMFLGSTVVIDREADCIAFARSGPQVDGRFAAVTADLEKRTLSRCSQGRLVQSETLFLRHEADRFLRNRTKQFIHALTLAAFSRSSRRSLPVLSRGESEGRMAVVLGLLASIAYGCADFFGGLSSRRAPVLTVVFLSQFIGTGMLILALPFFLSDPFSASAVAWGMGAGVAGSAGVTLLFRGLSIGRMSVVAPVTGTVAAGLPVVVGLISGERPSAVALAGVVVALLAVVLVSSGDHGADEPAHEKLAASGLPEAIGAGTCFGLFFVLLDKAGDASGLWPLVGARFSSLTVMGLALLVTRTALRPPSGTLPMIAAAGALDVAANLFYLLATRHGLLSLVAVLTSMYPATTVVLARFVLNERLTRLQLGGLLLAGAGIAAIAAG